MMNETSKRTNGNSLLRLLFRLDEYLIPETERQYLLKSQKAKDQILSDFIAFNKQRPKGEWLTVKVKGDRFSIAPSWIPLVSLFDPAIEGLIQSEDGCSNVAFRTANSNWAIATINAPFVAVVVVVIGYIASLYLLPHPILLFSAVLGAIGIPVACSLFTAIICKYRFSTQLKVALDFLCNACGCRDLSEVGRDGVRELNARATIPEEFIVGGICGAIYLGAAVALHTLAWNLWVEGKYLECANLCQPVAALAEAALGKDSATVGDCKYYLAESYRCAGKLPEAAQLYEQAIQIMAPTIGAENTFYADAVYNLGRVLEEQGRFVDADVQYKKALDIWANSPLIGAENIVYAKGVNRLGVLRIKTHNGTESEISFAEALKIDKRYSSQLTRVEEDLNDMSAGLIAQNKFESGLRMASKSLELKLRKGKNDLSLAPNYINLARAAIGLNQMDAAQKSFDRAAVLLGAAKTAVSVDEVCKLSALYGQKVKSQRALYEVPNFGTRSDITYLGDGRI